MAKQDNHNPSSDLEEIQYTPPMDQKAAEACQDVVLEPDVNSDIPELFLRDEAEQAADVPVPEIPAPSANKEPAPEESVSVESAPEEKDAEEHTPGEPEQQEAAPEESQNEEPAEEMPAHQPPVPESSVPEEPGQPETPEGETTEIGLSGIRVAMELCDRVTEAVGKREFHGGVRPDNISVKDGQVFLGSILRHGVGEFTPQELEYMAPELFWDGVRSPTADVYSVGLVLYSIYNYGRLPFWPGSGAVTPNARASALQKRMSDEALVPPAKADAELSAVILRALSFRVEERWQNVQELKRALSTCDESSSPVDISLAMSGLLTRTAETEPARQKTQEKGRTYYDEGEIREGRRPRRRRNLGWLWMVILGALVVGAAVLLMTSFSGGRINAESGPAIAAATSTPEPLETPAPTEAPTLTPGPTEKPHGAQYVVHVENVSWLEAAQRCRELGGTLAVPASEEEYQELIRVCTSARINYVWLGASRQPDGNWISVDGEPVTFFSWGKGEPSFTDSGDGAAEDFLMMWRSGETWPYNDSREDPLADYGWIFSGAIGYVCKMW